MTMSRVSQGMNGAKAPFRTDLQAMRGLAVLLVLGHHAGGGQFLPAGYLGVDIFFVLSGYLITDLIRRELDAGTFSFAAFYWRRAKRLLPAAFVVFLACTLASAFLLTRAEFMDFLRQLIGALGFSANIALWLQTGYFETAAQHKPLLHTWSLSIEEQYYAIVPAALAFVPRRHWRLGALVVTAASLALCLTLGPGHPVATFYLLPTRAWEMGIGSLGALFFANTAPSARAKTLFWPALTVLLLVPVAAAPSLAPGWEAVAVCMATLIVIVRRHPGDSPWFAPWVRVGDMSYSLYLVHWPLFAFASSLYVSPVPAQVRLGLAVAALALGYVLYRWVEQPLRRWNAKASPARVGVSVAVCGMALAGCVSGLHAAPTTGVRDFAELRRPNFGLNQACDAATLFDPQDCRSQANASMLVWGDSFAMHLVPGILASGGGVVQATRSVCGPLLGLALFETQGQFGKPFAQDCLAFNDSVLAYLGSHPEIRVVVLASTFQSYVEAQHVLQRDTPGNPAIEAQPTAALLESALARTVSAVRTLGRKVVIVAPPPRSGFDAGRCAELRAAGVPVFGTDHKGSCAISATRYQDASGPLNALLDRVAREADIAIVGFDRWLCNGQTCATEWEATPLYRDEGHLSVAGSRALGQRMRLAGLLESSAR